MRRAARVFMCGLGLATLGFIGSSVGAGRGLISDPGDAPPSRFISEQGLRAGSDSSPIRVILPQNVRIVEQFEQEGADIRDALKELFRQFGDLSYSIAPDVQGTITVSLRKVPFDEALRNVLKQVDAEFRMDAEVYTITRRETPDPQQGGVGGGFGGGGFGGGGFGGGQAGYGGAMQQQYDQSVRAVEEAIGRYLDGKEIKNILTPGEYSEWPLNLKAGQVLLAEARSDAFDPALEVVDGQGEGKHTVLAANDDRYPGDQRPLLLWRCTKDGAYALRARCFRDKSGGQFLLRMRLYESMDPAEGGPVEREFERESRFLVRVPMKAGQIKQILIETSNPEKYSPVYLERFISPLGLPDVGLAGRISRVIPNAIAAPVDGDYYAIASCRAYPPASTVKLSIREIVPAKIATQGGIASVKALTQTPAIWLLSVKKGDIVEAAAPELSIGARLEVSEAPDFASYDLKKPESNPFYPKTASQTASSGDTEPKDDVPALKSLSGRPRDDRYAVFTARKDAELWLATSGSGSAGKSFALNIGPGAKQLETGRDIAAQLKVGCSDYWYLDAKMGDVIRFAFKGSGFAEHLTLLSPNLESVSDWVAGAESGAHSWNRVIQAPGRYLLETASIGWGGGGAYSLRCDIVSAKEFRVGSPAKGRFDTGDVEVWKFTAVPDKPVFLHLKWSQTAFYAFAEAFNDKGESVSLFSSWLDSSQAYSIFRVAKPTTFTIVLAKPGPNADYLIELLDLPGFGKGG